MQDILGGGGNRGFDEYGTRLAAAQKSHVAAQSDPVVAASTAAVQGSYAEYYDPEDKNADWSGFVSKPRERQHASNPTAQRVQVGASDLGFMVSLGEEGRAVGRKLWGAYSLWGAYCLWGSDSREEV